MRRRGKRRDRRLGRQRRRGGKTAERQLDRLGDRKRPGIAATGSDHLNADRQAQAPRIDTLRVLLEHVVRHAQCQLGIIIIYGVLLILVMIYYPLGIAGAYQWLKARLQPSPAR